MERKISNKKLKYINIAVIAVLLTISIILILLPQASASSADTELEVINSTTVTSQVITINNIKNYANSQTKRTSLFLSLNGNSKTAIAKELYAKLGFSEEEIAEMNDEKLNSILNVESATVKQMYMAVTEDGESYSVAAQDMSRATNELNHLFPDIANDNGTTGYMAGRIEVYQDADYDKYDSTKDKETKETSITKFYAYGFRVKCSMWWLKEPAYKFEDAFVINWDGDAYTEASYSENRATYTYDEEMEFETINENITSRPSIVWLQNNRPSVVFNVAKSPGGSVQHIYKNHKITMKLKLRANNGFLINMGYAHKQVVGTGEFGYELGGSASIKFKLTLGARAYISGPLRVECIKNPEMEALR